MGERIAGDWDEAILLARSLNDNAEVRLSKTVAPALPPELSVWPSNFPWSVHKGAVAVYREDERGRHLQIREYSGSWVVSMDSYNPRYRPLKHATVNVPATMLIAMGALTPLPGLPADNRRPPAFSLASTVSFTVSTVSKGADVGRRLLSLPAASLLLAGRSAPRSASTWPPYGRPRYLDTARESRPFREGRVFRCAVGTED